MLQAASRAGMLDEDVHRRLNASLSFLAASFLFIPAISFVPNPSLYPEPPLQPAAAAGQHWSACFVTESALCSPRLERCVSRPAGAGRLLATAWPTHHSLGSQCIHKMPDWLPSVCSNNFVQLSPLVAGWSQLCQVFARGCQPNQDPWGEQCNAVATDPSLSVYLTC